MRPPPRTPPSAFGCRQRDRRRAAPILRRRPRYQPPSPRCPRRTRLHRPFLPYLRAAPSRRPHKTTAALTSTVVSSLPLSLSLLLVHAIHRRHCRHPPRPVAWRQSAAPPGRAVSTGPIGCTAASGNSAAPGHRRTPETTRTLSTQFPPIPWPPARRPVSPPPRSRRDAGPPAAHPYPTGASAASPRDPRAPPGSSETSHPPRRPSRPPRAAATSSWPRAQKTGGAGPT